MRALVVSDIHGNLHALEAVLAVARSHAGGGFDRLWNLGDMVGYGARPNEVLDLLRAFPIDQAIHVRGNHDRVCCGLTSSQGFNPVAAEAAGWTRLHLRPDNREWLRAVPMGPIPASARAMCAHGSPLHEDQYIASMRDAWTPLQRMETEITFFGHTHVQGGFSQQSQDWAEDRPVFAGQVDQTESWTMDVPVGSRHLINPGAVGQPRDGDWRAAFAIYDDALEQVTFFRTPYDVGAAQTAIRAAGLPERLAARLSTGR
jgi:diadenosine tetraphosphatase ApaH/serine/threonine PP2A family protein phosphatase